MATRSTAVKLLARLGIHALAICSLLAAAGSAHAQGGAEFYKGKQIRMIIGHPAGGDYDLGGRLLAKFLERHIPGQPTVIVQNMPGASSIIAANYLQAKAPKDGTVFGSFSRQFPNQALMGVPNIEADPRRFVYLGATSLPSRVCVVSNTARVKTVEDLLKQELIVSASRGSSLHVVPLVLNEVLNTKFKIIEGYNGAPDAMLAVERGEVEGICTSWGQFRNDANKFKEGKLRVIARAEEAPIAELANVPSFFELARTTEQKQYLRFVLSSTEFGRPYVFPPEVPAERVAIMRKAFSDAAHDPELLAEAARANIDMTYRTPADMEALIADLYETPPAMIEAIKKTMPDF